MLAVWKKLSCKVFNGDHFNSVSGYKSDEVYIRLCPYNFNFAMPIFR